MKVWPGTTAALVSLYYVSRPRDAIECVLELCNAIKRCALCGRPCGPVRTRVFAVHGRSFTHRFAAATRYVFTGPPLHRRCSQSESRWRRRWRPSLYRIVGFPLVPEGRGREGGEEGERERERERKRRDGTRREGDEKRRGETGEEERQRALEIESNKQQARENVIELISLYLQKRLAPSTLLSHEVRSDTSISVFIRPFRSTTSKVAPFYVRPKHPLLVHILTKRPFNKAPCTQNTLTAEVAYSISFQFLAGSKKPLLWKEHPSSARAAKAYASHTPAFSPIPAPYIRSSRYNEWWGVQVG